MGTNARFRCLCLIIAASLSFLLLLKNDHSYRWKIFRLPAPSSSISSYCYAVSDSTIFFLHLTNKSDEWHPLEMCAIKSAAVWNSQTGVCVLTQYPMRNHTALANLPSLEIAYLNASLIFEGTPLEDWYDSYVLNQTSQKDKILMWELSDALRYAYLYKYGGKYMDTDTWTLRSLSTLKNVAGWQDINLIANGVLFFEKGHPFMAAVLDSFTSNFWPGVWGSSGPFLVTAVHKSGIVNMSTYSLVGSRVFYPTHHTQSSYPFRPDHKEHVKRMTKNSYTLHLWRFMIPQYWNPGVVPPNGSYAAEFMEEICFDQ